MDTNCYTLPKWVCKGRLLKQPEQTRHGVSRTCMNCVPCVSAQDPTPRNERKVAVFCSNFLRTAAWPALYQRDLSSSLERASLPLLMSLLLASLWTSQSSFLFQVVQGLFSSKLSLYAVHKHWHRKKVKIGWTETRNKRKKGQNSKFASRGIVQTIIKIGHCLLLMSFQTCMIVFVLWNTKGKNWMGTGDVKLQKWLQRSKYLIQWKILLSI